MKVSSPFGECDWIQRGHSLKLSVADMIPITQYVCIKTLMIWQVSRKTQSIETGRKMTEE